MLKQPLPRAPVSPGLNVHWLAVDGVQPLIPENPSPAINSMLGANLRGANQDDKLDLGLLPSEMQVMNFKRTISF
jgi:hypothetical protein